MANNNEATNDATNTALPLVGLFFYNTIYFYFIWYYFVLSKWMHTLANVLTEWMHDVDVLLIWMHGVDAVLQIYIIRVNLRLGYVYV